MIVQNFKVAGQQLDRENYLCLVAGSRNLISFSFRFSPEWAGVAKTAIITTGGVTYHCLVGADGAIAPGNMPVLRAGECTVSVFGGDLYTVGACTMEVGKSGLMDGVPPVAPPPDIYNQILNKATDAEGHATTAENLANDSQNKAATEAKKAGESAVAAAAAADAAGLFRLDAAGSAQRAMETAAAFDGNAQTKTAAFDTHAAVKTKLVADEGCKQRGLLVAEGTRQLGLVTIEGTNQMAAAKMEAERAAGSAVAAKASETAADTSEAEALLSQQKAQQALADLLKIIGVDIATLVGGKIPMSQIPATATQEIYTVTSEAELVGLTAQRGDLAELITMVGGVKTITKTWQLLGTSTVAPDWIPWGTAYAVSAGNASTAGNADNAGMINNHRMVEMRQADFDTAAKDPATYYLVTA